MSDDMCKMCNGPARSNAKLHKCDNCKKYFHTGCMKLAPVKIDDKSGKACSYCIVNATPSVIVSRSRTSSNSSVNEAASHGPSDDAFSRILKEIENLKTSVGSRFDQFEAKLADFDGLAVRVAANKTRLVEVKQELAELKQRLDKQEENSALGTVGEESTLLTKMMSLEKSNAEMSTRLASINTLQHSLTTDLVISGLSALGGCDLKALATAVLVTVYPDIEVRDIVAVRPLMSKAVRGNADVTPMASSSTRPPSLLVTLKSRALLEEIIRGKIKRGKLDTTALAASLPANIKLESITPALININEFLPSHLFQLHRLIRQKAKQVGFMSFMRAGQFFVRRKKTDVATPINSEEDLNRFLVL